ncbi:hypothetical protein HBO12_02640 [Pseudomonas sp. WS 5059]|uniref:hypothetical protein n=1 Tax=unclassified Pseudomonas TaxID=196821 RepID=UPI0014726D71|nr:MULTISPECIES: hypothetical protein [unclassified Pseudomonas]NMY01834.1 hypothetical protein [Pseudomonas sp. WS 5059]NMY26030.1 hypothetical protein [Pseudomonas sp. WS 5021]
MTEQAQQLTPEQKKLLYPRFLLATGTFDARIDNIPLHFQTLKLLHDPIEAMYRLNARHADNSITVKKITIGLPNTVRQGQVLDLSKWQTNEVSVWYAIEGTPNPNSMRCSTGTLIVNRLQAGTVKFGGELNGTTDPDENGNRHTIQVDFDLTS